MIRKPANLKSKTEAIERMLAGENFYYGIQIIRFQEFYSEVTCNYGGIPFNTVSREVWDNFRHWEIEDAIIFQRASV